MRQRMLACVVAPVAALLLLSPSTPALGQARTATFPRVSSVGDVDVAQSPGTGRLHLTGGLRLETADYFRGAFDDVPESLDQFVIGPDLAVTFELLPDRDALLRGLSLTLGSQNGLAEQVQATDSLNDWWYESNNFVGLAARLPGDLVAGLTYTVYTSPNDVSPTFQELAAALKYTGSVFGVALNPQLKVATPLERQDNPFQTGVYTELALGPSVKILGDRVTLALPLIVGGGFDGYYGPGDDASVWGSAGLTASVPLRFIPSSYGHWSFSLGTAVIVRDDDIRRLSTFDREDTVVVTGKAALGFTY